MGSHCSETMASSLNLKTMKNLLCFIFILLIQQGFAQKSFYTELPTQEDCEFRVDKLIELKNNDFVGLCNSRACSDFADNLPSYLFKLDKNGKLLTGLNLPQNKDSSEVILELLEIPNNQLLALGKTFDFKNDKTALSFYILDYQLKIIKKKNFFDPSIVNYTVLKGYFDNNQIYFSAGIKDPSNLEGSYIGLSTLSLDIFFFSKNVKSSTSFAQNSTGVAKLKDKNNKNHFFLGEINSYREYDDSLKMIKKYSVVIEDVLLADFVGYQDKFISIAQSNIPINPGKPNSPYRREVGVRLLDKNFKTLKYAYLGKGFDNVAQKDTYDVPSIRAISWKDPNKLFVSGSPIPEFNIGPIAELKASVFVSKLDSNLNVKWTKHFWNDGRNFAFGVLATNDGGVVVYGNRDTLHTGYSNGFVMKLNENGFLTSEKETIVDNYEVIVAPNPFESNFTIAINNQNEINDFDFILYNTIGQIMYQSKLKSGLNQISLEGFPSGAMFYQIKQDHKNLKTGKLIKL
jgi:hypothetical protein